MATRSGRCRGRPPARVQQVLHDEWGRDLIRSWNTAGWITLSQRIGDKIARLVGAGAGELVVADSTSVNLYKALAAAMTLVGGRCAAGAAHDRLRAHELPDRPLHRRHGGRGERGFALRLVDADDLAGGDRRRHRDRDAHPRELPHRAHARHGGGDARGARRRRARGLGPRALGRRRARGARRRRRRRQRRRLRRGLRLQVPERRPRRAGLHLGASAPHRADGRRGLAASRSPAGSGTPRRSRSRPTTSPAPGITRFVCGTPPIAVAGRARVRGRHGARGRAVRRPGRHPRASRSRSPTSSSRSSTRAAPGTGSSIVTPRDHAQRAAAR